MAEPLLIARAGETEIALLPALANRHGAITGATGTGKTVTLQRLAEQFSRAGVPVFFADVKGDLRARRAGTLSPKAEQRLENARLPCAGVRRVPGHLLGRLGRARSSGARHRVGLRSALALAPVQPERHPRGRAVALSSRWPTTTACCCSTSKIYARSCSSWLTTRRRSRLSMGTSRLLRSAQFSVR